VATELAFHTKIKLEVSTGLHTNQNPQLPAKPHTVDVALQGEPRIFIPKPQVPTTILLSSNTIKLTACMGTSNVMSTQWTTPNTPFNSWP